MSKLNFGVFFILGVIPIFMACTVADIAKMNGGLIFNSDGSITRAIKYEDCLEEARVQGLEEVAEGQILGKTFKRVTAFGEVYSVLCWREENISITQKRG